TLIRLLVWNKLRIGIQAVFEIVDADLRRFTIADRTKMSGYLEPAFVRFFDSRSQFGARDVHVGFERSSALVCPKVDHLPRVFGITQLVHNRGERSASLQIRRSDMHLWSEHSSRVDQPFDFKVGEGGYASGCADRCDAEGQVKTGKAYAHVGIHRR